MTVNFATAREVVTKVGMRFFVLKMKNCICTIRCFTTSLLFFHWLDTHVSLTTTDVTIVILSDMQAQDFTKETFVLVMNKMRGLDLHGNFFRAGITTVR